MTVTRPLNGARGAGAAAMRRRTGPSGWMVAPALGFFLVFAIIPLIVALYLSFTRWDAITDPAWVGLDNWASVLVDPVAIDALVLTLKVIVISWIVQTPISLLLGTWTAGKQRNRAVLGAIFFLPLLLSSAATAIAFKAILDPNFGLSASLGIPFLKQDWLGNQQLVLFVVIFIIAWQFVPFHTLLFQGGVRQIPASLYEAAEIDGAGTVKQFFHITLPQLRYTLVTSSTLMIIGSLTYFDVIFVLTGGVPSAGTRILPILMYVTGFSASQFGQASVMAIILAVIGLAIALLLTKLSGFAKMDSQQEGL
ncbi:MULTISPECIES: carbohydrate ABC transporter permease [Plantibacter]|jgi:raffinose/stachyose/melibiose transport system permease protein|uniref:Carbohydrate ABC transporter membrane protein 1 (CUT1 family) n=3 Tax=Plantibacter TaxID=190323 RepID=A0A1S7BC41_9MICO|nr:ABC transporter [Plantibacter flavus]OII43458.1 ABC transporter [Plantibacter sp. MMLR14_011]CAH0233510.1 L-arabinose transport system permease protein AraP [Plantibacter cousiniae]SMQ73585.1 carbohydrate ABC transporter membrane protein 1, CUT1 family [Plantibacter sp. VKM Ac-1784]VXA98571.1 Carbohydrate ABC transporter membrane protein 1, CUT1 family [Plantibacter sp. T3]